MRDDGRPLGGDGALAASAHRPRQEHRSARARTPRAPCHGEPVIAVGGAADRQVRDAGGGAAGSHIGDREGLPQSLPQQVDDCVGTAQRLEAAEAEAPAFVLQPQRLDAERLSEAVQPMQRRRSIALEARDRGARGGAALPAGSPRPTRPLARARSVDWRRGGRGLSSRVAAVRLSAGPRAEARPHPRIVADARASPAHARSHSARDGALRPRGRRESRAATSAGSPSAQ